MSENLLQAFANRTNQAILGLLAVEPTYPRALAQLLDFSETEVSRRLRHMEQLGIVAGGWRHVQGRNVKAYELQVAGAKVEFGAEGMTVALVGGTKPSVKPAMISAVSSHIPEDDGFLGRGDEMAALAGAPVVLVEGLPGIGKTQLIANFARSLDGPVFWHTMRGVESLRWLGNRFAVFLAGHGHPELFDALDAEPQALEDPDRIIRAADVAGMTFVLDDIHLPDDPMLLAFFSEAIARWRHGRLVLASRVRPAYNPTLQHVRCLALEGLADDTVERLLGERGCVVPAALMPRLREEVGGHPLALNLLLEAMEQDGIGLEAFLDRIPERDLEDYLLHEIHGGLSEDQRRVLGHASIFRTSFTRDDLRALSSKDPAHTLSWLRRRHMVQADPDGYYLHEVVRNFFYNLLSGREELHGRVAHSYLDRGTIEGRLEAMHHYLQGGRRDDALNLLRQDLDLRDFDFIDGGYHNLYLAILQKLGDGYIADPARRALVSDDLGDIHLHRGEAALALDHYAAAAATFEELKDKERLGDLAWKRALALQRLDRRAEAVALVDGGLQSDGLEDRSRRRLEQLREELA